MKVKPFGIAFCILLLTLSSLAQKKSEDFGTVTLDELNMKECSFEKDAPAMFLVNEESIVIKQDYNVIKTTYEKRVRIKIFSERGFDYASIFIKNAKTRYSKLENLEAYVYNLSSEGKIISQGVSRDQIFKEKANTKTKATSLHFTFPNLKSGSVIEYRYTKVVKNAYGLEPWLLQDQIPVLVSSCNVTVPPNIDIISHIVAPQQTDSNSVKIIDNTGKISVSKKFILREIPSFKIEPYMSSVTDNLERIEFAIDRRSIFVSSISSDRKWQMIGNYLLFSPFFETQLTQTIKGTETIIDSIKVMGRDAKKIEAAYTLVTERVKWNNEQFFIAENIADAWETHSGSSAEINLLILYFLKNAGVECKPLLVSTRENGKLDMQFPTLSQFNGLDILVEINGTNYIIDGTQKYQSFLIPPLNILNRDAFVLDSKCEWITVYDDKPFMTSSTYIKAVLDSTGLMRGNLQISMKDYAKAEKLKDLERSEEEQKEEEKDFLRYDDNNLVIDSVKMNDTTDFAKPLNIDMKFHYALSNNDNYYFLNPFFFSMFRKNPFTSKERQTDIDFGCMQNFTTYAVIDIPENFTFDEIPNSTLLRTADTSISFRKDIAVSTDQIGIRFKFEINNPTFTQKNYPGIKEFFDKIYTMINQQIVLKRKQD